MATVISSVSSSTSPTIELALRPPSVAPSPPHASLVFGGRRRCFLADVSGLEIRRGSSNQFVSSFSSRRSRVSRGVGASIFCRASSGPALDGKALSLNSDLHSASCDHIEAISSFLQSKGILEKDLPRIFHIISPKVLTADIKKNLIPVFDFLSNDLNVPDCNFRKVINKCPRLLTSSVENQLQPALFYLKKLGFRDLHALAYQESSLLVLDVEKTLIRKLNYLMSLGFSRGDAVGMVLRFPGLFTISIENNYVPKFEYFDKEIGGELDELKEFPWYFAFSLEKRIKPRHLQAVKCGVKVPLPLLLKTLDYEFADFLARQKSKKVSE